MRMAKRYIRGFIPLVLALLVGLLVYTVCYAATWQYGFPTTVVDNSSTTRTNYPVLLGYGAQQLIDAGDICACGEFARLTER